MLYVIYCCYRYWMSNENNSSINIVEELAVQMKGDVKLFNEDKCNSAEEGLETS